MIRAAVLAMILGAGGASAQPGPTPGTWTVSREGGPGPGEGYCTAETRNERGQGLLLLKDSLTAPLIEWSRDAAEPIPTTGPERRWVTTGLTFDVDYERWTLDAADDGNRTAARVGDPADFQRLQRDLADATALAVIDPLDGDRQLALFSLKGSRQALADLDACWRGL